MNESHVDFAKAHIRHRHAPSGVWIVPILAAIIALYMAWHSYAQHGSTITITFNSADGLVAGQTQVKYRAVTLGTVSEITLDSKLQKVEVKVKMLRLANELLTEKAQFWVVKPRFTPGNLSGIETLVSGSYIQCDPGASRGSPQTHYTGLEEAPASRSDEQGQTFRLQAERLGAINRGSPVYFRDINVGEVLSYDIGNGFGPISLTVFVRSPYDKIVNRSSRFWNSSSLSVSVGPTGIELQMQSLQALIAGGIAFYTPKQDDMAIQKDQVFTLFANKHEAEVSGFHKPTAFISYFDSSFKNIGPGSPVYIQGIQVGEVSDVKLLMDYEKAQIKVQVRYSIQPERAFLQSKVNDMDPLQATRHLVEKGLRAKVDSGGLLPGQSGLSLAFVHGAPAAEAYMEGDYIYMPVVDGGGGLDAIASSLSDIAAKLNQIPIEQIGANLNNLLGNANNAVKGFDPNSDFQHDARRTLDQVGDAARSVRLLADFLSHHPEALIRGRSNREKDQ